MNTYLVVIGKTSTGYSAHCPDVLGCAAVGTTIEKVLSNMKKALELHFEGMAEDHQPIPKPRSIAAYRQTMKDLDPNAYLFAHVQIDVNRFGARSKRQTRSRKKRRSSATAASR